MDIDMADGLLLLGVKPDFSQYDLDVLRQLPQLTSTIFSYRFGFFLSEI
jgi:hypothetical protein